MLQALYQILSANEKHRYILVFFVTDSSEKKNRWGKKMKRKEKD